MFKIKDIKISNPVILAPMAGVSNSSYRKIVKNMGAGLVYGEMVSSNALVYQNSKTLDLLKMAGVERPIAQQIFGSDPKIMGKAAKIVESTMHPDIIDINMGCPVPKVAQRANSGSALLKDPDLVRDIVSTVVKSVSIPVTVKIRSGWDDNHINAIEIARICEASGASAIAIHARTRSQGYSGKANWDIIKEVKESVSIPVIGNGDITSPETAKEMLDYTGCDAVMIGRAAIGNPWIFRETLDYLTTGEYTEPTYIERIDMIKTHYNLLKEDIGTRALKEIRMPALSYVKGMPESKIYKDKICKSNTEEEFLSILDEYKTYLSNLTNA